jgi:hypothetical protein
MGRVMGRVAGILLSAAAVGHASGDKIAWDKPDAAFGKAAMAGKPIVWYFTTNEFDKDAGLPVATNVGAADLAFTNESVLKRRDQFLWVRGDQTLATKMKIRGAPMVRITDPEGDTIVDAPINGPEPLLVAMVGVLKEKFVDKPVKWGSIIRTGPIRTSFLVVAFDAPDGEGLKLWEDRSLVKYHKMCDFVRLEAAKGSEIAKKFGVAEFPAFLICDAQERVLERVAGKKADTADLRLAVAKAWRKLENKK